MPDQEEIEQQKLLLETHRRTLTHLLHEQSYFDPGYVPSHVAHGIAQACAEIQQSKRILREWGITVADHPDDESPPLLSPSTRRPSRSRKSTFLAVVGGIGIIAVIVSGIYGFFLRPIPQMTGDVRIAIPVLRDNPQLGTLSATERKARTLQLVENVKHSIGTGIGATPDLNFVVWGPQELTEYHVATDDLTQLARDTDANIVIYGNIGENDQGEGQLSLGLQVSDANVADAAELLGVYYVGEPIRYLAPWQSISAQSSVSAEIQTRIETMTALILGISELSRSGSDFRTDLAERYFENAAQLIRKNDGAKSIPAPQCPPGFVQPPLPPDATNRRAEATVLVLQGNLAFRSRRYQQAQERYSRALARSCDYARAYVGMAVSLTRQAIDESPRENLLALDQDAQRIYGTKLKEAEYYFTWAQQALWRPEDAIFSTRLLYGQGEWHLGQARLPDVEREQELAAARAAYTDLITEYESAPPERQRLRIRRAIVASAYANRGLASTNNDPLQAIRDYQQAIEIEATDPESDRDRRATWLGAVTELYIGQGNCVEAKHTIQQALDLTVSDDRQRRMQSVFSQVQAHCG